MGKKASFPIQSVHPNRILRAPQADGSVWVEVRGLDKGETLIMRLHLTSDQDARLLSYRSGSISLDDALPDIDKRALPFFEARAPLDTSTLLVP